MRKSLGVVILTLLLGMIIGAILSNVIGLFLEEGTVAHQLFVQPVGFGPELHVWDLVVIQITFGIKLQFNFMSVVGVFIASQMLRWYR
jgi:hypothetical protein